MNKFFLITAAIVFNISILSANGQDNFDVRAVKQIQTKRTTGKTSFFKTMSATVVPIGGIVPVSLFVQGLIAKNKDDRNNAIYIAGSNALTIALTFGMKKVIDRPRPSEHDPAIIALEDVQSGSFPSAHASVAFSTATSLSIIYPKWYVIIPAHAWASLVSYSRIYLGVHYPTDLFAGAITGSGSAWLSHKLNQWIKKEKKRKVLKTM